MGDLLARMSGLLSEFRRRRIFRVLGVYAAAAFVVAQVAALAKDAFHLPSYSFTLIVLLCVLGFPIAAVLAWALEITPEGVRRAEAFRAPEDGGHSHATARTVFASVTLLGTALLGLGAWHLFLKPAPASPEGPTVAAVDPTDLAVLYFDTHGPGEELRYLADGLTEGLIDELAAVPALDVKSRTAVKPFRTGEATQDSIVRVLGVGSLVEGSVRRMGGDSVRVTVQLIDAATGDHLKSAELVRSWPERLGLERDIVVAASDMIRRALGIELELWERRQSTESPEAWTLLQKAERDRDDAHRLAADGETAAAARRLAEADSSLVEAEGLDPGWMEPVLLRGWIAGERASLSGPTPDSREPGPFRRGIAFAERALEMSPGHAGALELRGVLRFRLSRIGALAGADTLRRAAESDLRAAVERNADRARAWAELSELYRLEGRNAEALLAAEHALRADAFLSDAYDVVLRLYKVSLDLERMDEAVRWCENGRSRFPDRAAFVACSLFHLALPDGPEPDIDRAWELYGRLDELSPVGAAGERNRLFARLWVAAVIARAAVRDAADEIGPAAAAAAGRAEPDAAGRAGEEVTPARLEAATSLADSALAVAARTRRAAPSELEPWIDYYEANVRQHLEQRDEALALLEEYVSALPDMREKLEGDWMFRALWDDPRFEELIGAS